MAKNTTGKQARKKPDLGIGPQLRRTGGVLRQEVDKIADAVVTILNSSETPVDLYNKIGDWITTAVSIEDEQGESLLERWNYHPETVAACLEWAREADLKKKRAEAMLGKEAPRG